MEKQDKIGFAGGGSSKNSTPERFLNDEKIRTICQWHNAINIFKVKVSKFDSFAFQAKGFPEINSSNQKIAFTLAEVLVTLGIIGIIAAITIPNLMGYYRKVVAENKLKSTYSLLSNVLEQVNSEHDLAFIPEEIYKEYGDADGNGYSRTLSIEVFEHYFAPHLQITKRYGNDIKIANAKNEGVYSPHLAYFVRLKNGVGLGFMQQNQGKGLGVDNSAAMMWWIILSPSKKVLVAGKDIFHFQVQRNLKKNDYKMNLKAIDSGNASRAKIIENCVSPFTTPHGTFWQREHWCTVLIFQNGMRIPDDYPVKF